MGRTVQLIGVGKVGFPSLATYRRAGGEDKGLGSASDITDLLHHFLLQPRSDKVYL